MSRALRTSFGILLLLSPAIGRTAFSQKARGDSRSKPRAIRSEEMRYYKRWLKEDVLYIISAEEKSVFSKLTTAEEREKFMEEFWRRRDPSPETLQNEFKEEHYRRIAYANEHFAAGKPGWLTDRGRIYITFGPPDRKETNPTGTQLIRSPSEGGSMTTYPFEVWEYRYLEGVGTDVTIEFVDKSGTNNYEIALDDYEKDALFMITGSHIVGGGQQQRVLRTKDMPFERLDVYSKLSRPPPVKFKKLAESVTTRVTYHQLPLEVQDNYLRLTDESVLAVVAVAIKNRNLSFEGVGDSYRASVNLYGRITDISKKVVEVFEDVLKARLSRAEVKQGLRGMSMYQKKATLRPGRYILDAVFEDTLSGRMGSIQKLLIVPRLDGEDLASSSLILAAEMSPTRSAEDLRSQFVLGDLKVVPNVGRHFIRGDRMGVYLQVYHLTLDQAHLKPAIEVTGGIYRDGERIQVPGTSDISVQASGRQVTLTSIVDTSGLRPGQYLYQLDLVDKISDRSLARSLSFTIQ